MKILFLINDNYPNGDAGAVRQHAFATLLKDNGHKVKILCLNRPMDAEQQHYEEIPYQLIGGKYLDCRKQLKNYLKNSELPDVLVLNSIPLPAFQYAKRYAEKNNIQLVHDCVEWFSLNQYSMKHMGTLLRSYLATSLINCFLIDRNFKVIAISSYLEEYFKRKKIKSIRVPVIMDVSGMSWNKEPATDKLTLTYAGGAVRRDYLPNITAAIELLEEREKNGINFTLLGVDINNLADHTKKTVEEIEKISWLTVHKRVSRKEVLEKLEHTDFTILIRSEKARYAKAGFPTKVVESLSSGTPVILNLTSDLGMYLKNGIDCITVQSENPADIAAAIRKALELSPEQKTIMYSNARKTAEENFEQFLYKDKLMEFLEL